MSSNSETWQSFDTVDLEWFDIAHDDELEEQEERDTDAARIPPPSSHKRPHDDGDGWNDEDGSGDGPGDGSGDGSGNGSDDGSVAYAEWVAMNE